MKIKKTISIILTTVLTTSMLSSTFAASISDFSDIPNNWARGAIERAIENGLLSGIDGKIEPNSNLTRAQMATIVNKAFGAYKEASISQYNDVPSDAWYYSEMSKAVYMGTFEGSDGRLSPSDFITREQAFSVLARALKLEDGDLSSLNKFNDSAEVSQWAKSSLAALVEKGYVNGSNGFLNPKGNITRAEFAQIMDSVIKEYVNSGDTYSNTINGNVMINKEGTNLSGVTISGDLIIGDGVKSDTVKLSDVKVEGRIVIRGGGNVNFDNTNTGNVIVTRKDGAVSLEANENSSVRNVNIQTEASLKGDFQRLSIYDDTSIDGNVTQITVNDNSSLNINSGVVDSIIVNKGASGTKLNVAEKAEVTKVTNYAESLSISGKGKVADVEDENKKADITTKDTKLNGVKVSKNTNSSSNYNNTSSSSSKKVVDLNEFSDVVNLRVGSTETRRIRMTPSDAKIRIKNNNSSIVSVSVDYDDEELDITAMGTGEAEITVIAYKDGYTDAEEKFTVYSTSNSSSNDSDEKYYSFIIGLNDFEDVKELRTGEINKQKVAVTPEDAKVSIIEYEPSIATAEFKDGFVEIKGVSEGETIIGVAAEKSGGKRVFKKIHVSVVDSSKYANINDFSNVTELIEGNTVTQDIVTTPADAQISAESSDEKIAAVKLNGNKIEVTGIGEGTATIKVTAAKEGLNSTVKTFNVTVVPKQNITLNDFADISDLLIGEIKTQDIAVTPTDVQISLESSNQEIATAKLNGNKIEVTGVNEGTAVITIKGTKENYNDILKTFNVTVIKNGISLNEFSNIDDLKIGEVKAQDIDITPDDAQVVAESNNEGIATVKLNNNKVEVTGVSEGTATISVTATKEGYNTNIKTFSVTVSKNDITINDLTDITDLKVNDMKSQDIVITPQDAKISVQSNNTGVATVNLNGNKAEVTGVNEGNAVITVTVEKEGYNTITKTFNVTVSKQQSTLNKFSNITDLNVGAIRYQDITATPSDAAITATTTNLNVVTANVESNKVKLTGIGEGTATISVKLSKNGYNDSVETFTVTVLKPEKELQNMVLNKPADVTNLKAGQITSQGITVNPNDAILYVESGNTGVATAQLNGSTVQITGVSEGTAAITVRAIKEGYNTLTTTFNVTVVNDSTM